MRLKNNISDQGFAQRAYLILLFYFSRYELIIYLTFICDLEFCQLKYKLIESMN